MKADNITLEKNQINKAGYKTRVKNDMATAIAYTKRKPAKHKAEMNTIFKALEYTDNVTSVLDAPCGVGRAAIALSKKGYNPTGVDLGNGAVEVARHQAEIAGIDVTFEQGDIRNLPFESEMFDAILCFRLYHHFADDVIRQEIIDELCRVSKKYVLISYLSPYAYTSIKRLIRAKLGGKASRQYTTKISDLTNNFEKHNFRLIKDIPQFRFVHTLHVAVFKKTVVSNR